MHASMHTDTCILSIHAYMYAYLYIPLHSCNILSQCNLCGVVYITQTLAHTKAAGSEEVLKRIEKELRLKLEESKLEIDSLTQKVNFL